MTDQKPLTLAAYKKRNAQRLDDEWAAKYPGGLGYIIQIKDGGVVWGVLTSRPTSAHQRSKWRGSTAKGYSGWYMGKSFCPRNVLSHKTYPDLDKWAEDLRNIFTDGDS